MKTISNKELQARLSFDNTWWDANFINPVVDALPRRSYYKAFYSLLKQKAVNRAVILMGPRRVGKTVMVYHAISQLLKDRIIAKNILYISLETPIYTGQSLETLVRSFTERFGHERNAEIFCFFDEIQYLKDWETHLKSLVDSFPSFRFIATGSAAAALRLKSDESGAGRFTDFLLPPLTFAEYLRFIDREEELIIERRSGEKVRFAAADIGELNKEFLNYLNYGGYPEAVFSEEVRSNSSRFIRSDIIDKVLLRDLPGLYGISDVQELNRLFTTIAYNTGLEISLEGLAQSSGVAKNTIKRYLEYLEAAFLIRRINRIDENARRFKRIRQFKVYLTNCSMRGALFGYIDEDDADMGALTETAIYCQWMHSKDIELLHYARWKSGEVDIVALNRAVRDVAWAVEVKWSNKAVTDRARIQPILSFAHKHKLKNITVTTRTESHLDITEDLQIFFQPSAELCYILGKR